MPPTEESQNDFTGLAVAVGRIEEGMKGVKESVDSLVQASKNHDDTLNRHEVQLQLLQARLPKRSPWYQTAGFILAAIVAAATVGGVIIALVQVAQAVQNH